MEIVIVEDPEDVDVVHPLVEAMEDIDAETVGIPDVLVTGLVEGTDDVEGTVEGVTSAETVATGVVVNAAEDVGYEDGVGTFEDVGFEVTDGAAVGVATGLTDSTDETDAVDVDVSVADEDTDAELL